MPSMFVSSKNLIGQRWDHGFHAFQQNSFLERWSKKYSLEKLGDIIEQDSYGILTPGNVYSSEHPIRYLRVTDMRPHLEIDFNDMLCVPEEYYRHERARLRPNDILLAVKGASIASDKSVSFVSEVETRTIVNGTVFRFQVQEPNNPHFVAVMFDSEILKEQIRNLQISNNAVAYVDKPSIHALRIPLPPRPIQDRIAQVMKDAYATRQQKLVEAEKLLSNIDDYFFGRLNWSPDSVQEEKRFLVPIGLLRGGRFDVAFNMGFRKFDPYMDNVSELGKVATFSHETRDPSRKPEDSFLYIDISSIDIGTGEIRKVTELIGADAPSRARQVVHSGDVIVSTVRPSRGAIAVVPPAMDNFICSTGFAILRPKESTTLEFLHTALRLNTTLEQFDRRSAGSSYPAILEKDIKATLIPFPPREVQSEIAVEVMRRRAQAKQLRAEAEQNVRTAKARVEKMILGEIEP